VAAEGQTVAAPTPHLSHEREIWKERLETNTKKIKFWVVALFNYIYDELLNKLISTGHGDVSKTTLTQVAKGSKGNAVYITWQL
jgi:hypothetical protein